MRESGRLRPILALGGALIAAVGLAVAAGTVAQANPQANGGNGHTPVTLCHFVPAHGGSFITITVDDDGSSGNANLQGHAGHPNDIIPAPADGCPATNKSPEVTETKTAMPTETNTEVVENTATPTNTAIIVNTATPTNTAQVVNTATMTSTMTATSTSTPGGGAAGTTTTPQATATSSAAASTPTTGAAAAAATTPAAGVAGAAALPSTGTGGGGGGPSWYLLGLGLAMLIGGASMSVAAYRQRRR